MLDVVKKEGLNGAAERGKALALSSVALASALGRAWRRCACCDDPVNYFQQACIAVR